LAWKARRPFFAISCTNTIGLWNCIGRHWKSKEDTGGRWFGCGRYIQQHGDCIAGARKAGRCHRVV
jgi:hypothetical protein